MMDWQHRELRDPTDATNCSYDTALMMTIRETTDCCLLALLSDLAEGICLQAQQ